MFRVVIIRHIVLSARPGMGYSALVGLDALSLPCPWYGRGKCYKCYAPCGAEGRHSLLHCSGGMDKNRLRRDSSSEGTNASPARDDGMTLNAENKPCLAGQHRQCYTMQTHYDVMIVKEIEIVLRGEHLIREVTNWSEEHGIFLV